MIEIFVLVKPLIHLATLLLLNELILQIPLKRPLIKLLLVILGIVFIASYLFSFLTVFSNLGYLMVVIFILCQKKRKIWVSLVLDLYRLYVIGICLIISLFLLSWQNFESAFKIVELSIDFIVLLLVGLSYIFFKEPIQVFFQKFEIVKVKWQTLVVFYLIEWVIIFQMLLVSLLHEEKVVKWIAVFSGSIFFLAMIYFLLLISLSQAQSQKIVQQETEKNFLQQFISKQENYYQGLLDKNASQRKLRHDFRLYMMTCQIPF